MKGDRSHEKGPLSSSGAGLCDGSVRLFCSKKPFRELTGAEIRSASVRLSPPDLTVLIQDTDRLAELLQDVTLYEAAPSYTEYAGQAAAFTLELGDGTQTTVTAFSPFLILDGVGYRTKHGPCEALNRYANDLLAEDGAPLLLTEPPALTVICGDTAAGALLGTYSWQWQSSGGSWEGTASDSAHPLDCRKLLLPLETGGGDRRAPVPGRARLHRGRPLLERRPLV